MTCAYSPLYLFIQLRAVKVSKVCLPYWTQLCKATDLFCLIPAVSTSLSTYHWEGEEGRGKRWAEKWDGWMDGCEGGRKKDWKKGRMEEGAKEEMQWKRKKPSSGLWTPSLLLLLYHTRWWSKVNILAAQLYLTLCDPMSCSPPGSSVHGILQARILEWLSIPFSKGSSWPRDQTQVSCIAGDWNTFLNV